MQITVTRPPVSMIALACLPTSVPAATAARNMSPVDSCGMLSSETSTAAKRFVESGAWELDIAGERYPAVASLRPMYDPENLRIKA